MQAPQEKTVPGSHHSVQTLQQGTQTHTHIGTNGVKLKAEVQLTCIKNKNYNDFLHHYNSFFSSSVVSVVQTWLINHHAK